MADTDQLAKVPESVESEEDIRGICAVKFEAVDVDWQAFNAENSAGRGQKDAVFNRMLQVIMSKDDEQLTAGMAKDRSEEGIESALGLIDRFNEHAAHLREGATAFEHGASRQMVALYRVLYRRDRDGNPSPEAEAPA